MSNEPELAGVFFFALSVLVFFFVIFNLVIAAKASIDAHIETKKACRNGYRKKSWFLE